MTIQRDDFSQDVSTLEYNALLNKFSPATDRIYRTHFKRVLDVLFVVLVAPFVVPVVLFVAALIARDGHNPFFLQPRVGINGKEFRMWKLRTMVPNAEEKLQNHLDENGDAKVEWLTKQKLVNDPRVTSFGHILRKLSIDELPQFWNVLKGEMSVVGPRPMMPEQRTLYPGTAYYRLRPGITGFWQVSDRNNTSFAARASYDDRYDEEVSFVTDVNVLFATLGVILRGTGH